DVGLFPNRCEGGTNLVMMEYMACGKPVIASNSTGHRDILTDDNSLPLKALRSVAVMHEGRRYAMWDDPDLDETVQQLEWAYQHREALKPMGVAAGQHLARFTWARSAAQFYRLLTQQPGGARG